ncbi:hypothetical protein C1903_05135 [Listeria ivanovii]|uniref:hypothetical protein n=1 Tax=Listeria ivanovii TaxID=1638 RepID=UPI000DA76D0A|nr:hypothetical protein [Listeria ivanovii]PZF89690.1 hypothetical protein C1905_05655 [Listeria ivanovii]PZF95176.1 hypothetical protein C1903_05135 [Listeria ivanovii]PZG05580.1 hypothetical protein C2L88_05130 [Listeria ivanovii]PZG10360.1 hypothetical protein C1901_05265 [Listeria ivanovii]PZG27163.1 hypothetical protein C1900_05660 [Listeria ivanovii]
MPFFVKKILIIGVRKLLNWGRSKEVDKDTYIVKNGTSRLIDSVFLVWLNRLKLINMSGEEMTIETMQGTSLPKF